MRIVILILFLCFAVPAQGQYFAKNNEPVIFAWTWNAAEQGVAAQFVVEQAPAELGPFTAFAAAAGTATESPAKPIVFPSGTNRLFFRVVGVDDESLPGEPSATISVSRLIGPPKNPREK